MGQASRPLALIVEDDSAQREILNVLLEESEIKVLECESAEAAVLLLEKVGPHLCLLFTDVQLAGHMDGATLAVFAKQHFPNLPVIVTSGRPCPKQLPSGAKFMPKPWRALDVLREAESAALAKCQ
jgi:CheY-like chemotaxis protein